MRVTRTGLAVVLTVVALTSCQNDASPSAAGTPAARPASTDSPSGESGSGGALVFQAEGSIWVQAPGEPRRRAAPSVQTDAQHPDWSPDGSQIAFEANFNTIWTVGYDGSGELARFTCEEACAAVYEPAWSPDGTTLAFIRILGDGTHTVSAQLMALDLQSGTTTVLHEDTAGDVWEFTPRWSSDSSRIVLEHVTFATNLLDEEQVLSSQLRVVDVRTGSATTIAGTAGAQSPDWSPTTELIVYSDGVNLFTIRADGSHRKRLTRFKAKRQSAIQPTFTPDASGVVFTWGNGAKGSGAASTVPAIVSLSTGSITTINDATGATHVRIGP